MDTPQGVGISWACATSGHGNCQQPGCRCMCHYYKPTQREQRELVSQPLVKVPTPPSDADRYPATTPSASGANSSNSQHCPKCGQPAVKQGDAFCRRDGTRLEWPHCGKCGAEVAAGDTYCGGCGEALAEQPPESAPAEAAPTIITPTVTN